MRSDRVWEIGKVLRQYCCFIINCHSGRGFRSRGYVTPQDVKSVGYDVLRHRVSVTYEAEAEDITSENLLGRIFDRLKVP